MLVRMKFVVPLRIPLISVIEFPARQKHHGSARQDRSLIAELNTVF